MYFNDEFEPEDFKFNFEKDINEYNKENYKGLYVCSNHDNIREYFDAQTKYLMTNSEFKFTEKENEDRKVYYIKINLKNNDEDI